MREDRSKSEEGEGREEEEEDDGDMAAEEDEMAAMLGFGGFGSTKVSPSRRLLVEIRDLAESLIFMWSV
jgi:hypothetical protein